MQGQFSDSSYFLLKDFFYEVKHSKYTDKPVTDFKWEITFVSTIVNDDGTVDYLDNPFTFDNSIDDNDIIFTNFETNIFNLDYHNNPNEINTKNSYIISPFININTHGNGIVNLFVKEYDAGYTPISVKYLNTQDDRFNFSNNAGHTLIPGDTITASLSGDNYYFDVYNTDIDDGATTFFNNNRETYWRKDSLFHYWLVNMAHDYYLDKWGIDLTIRNYVNYDKIFLLFHKIFKSRDEKTSRIIFYGMKNFVMDAIPAHQRTPKFNRFMDIFFDELYQENYNSLKEIWNMIDPMFTDRKYLGYLSKFYDMFDVDTFNIPELHLREFVRDMIWILKRKGTYTDFFILWRVLTSTRNRLNIYERWHVRNPAQWDTWPQEIDPNDTDTWPNYPYYMYDAPNNITGSTNVPTSAWHDTIYTLKPEYEQPPISGGAGPLWYKNNYPMTIEACMTDMDAQVTYIREGAYVYTKHEIESTVWELNHNLNQKNVLTQIFDENFVEVQPISVFYIDENNVTIILPTEMRGYAFVKLNDLLEDRTLFAASEWDIYTGFDNQNVIAQYSNDDVKMIEKDTWLKDENHVVVSEDVPNYIFTQTDPASAWYVPHEFLNDPHVQVFDDNLERMIPSDVTYISEMVIVTFDSLNTGYVIVLDPAYTGTQYPISTVWYVSNDTGTKELKIDFTEDGRDVFESETVSTSADIISEFSEAVGITRKAAVSPANYVHIQNNLSQEWIINHNLFTSKLVIDVYDFNDTKFVSSDYAIIDRNQVKIFFEEPVDGYAVIVIDPVIDTTDRIKTAFMLTADWKFVQDEPASVWRVPYTDDIKGFMVAVYNDDDIKVHPEEYNLQILNDTDTVNVIFSDERTGYVLLEEICNFIDTREDSKMMLSTHYIVEIDINDEPMNIHQILSEDTWNDISAYWEYLRPVNRVADYRIVFAPITNFTGFFESLYGDNSNVSDAYALSKSVYYHGLEQGAYIHSQTEPSSAWMVQHNLGEHIHVQVFDEDFNEIIPYEIVFESLSVMKLLFREPNTGFGIMKRADEYQIQDPITNIWNVGNSLGQKELVLNFAEDYHRVYEGGLTLTDYASSEARFHSTIIRDARIQRADFSYVVNTSSTTWTINHNLDTRNIMARAYDSDNNIIFHTEYIQPTTNQIVLTFDEPVTGTVLLNTANNYNQTIESTEWVIDHGFESHVNIQAFDENHYEIIPSEIIHTSDRISTVIFNDGTDTPTGITGNILITRTDEYQTQPIAGDEWDLYHALNAENIIVDFSENNEQIVAASFQLTGLNSASAEFETNIDVDDFIIRDGVLSEGNYIFRQDTPAVTWNVIHNLGIKGLVINVYDMNDERIHPKDFTLIDPSRLEVSFNKPQDGYIVLLKVGNLTLDGFDFSDTIFKLYENEGDLISGVNPIYESGIDRVIESTDTYYIERTIPIEYEFSFSEIGIFHQNGSLLFYTKNSTVFKPENVMFTIHYRIEKII